MRIEFIFLLFVMTILGAIAGLFLKRASAGHSLAAIILNYNLYLGGLLYLLSMLLNIYLLRFMEYTVVLPLTSITYIWTMFVSYLFLKEKITPKKITGVCCIITGAIILVL